MGYDVHITRKANWFDDGPEISLDEWIAVVRADPEMRLDGFAEATTSEGVTIGTDGPAIAVWTAYSGHRRDGNMAWMHLAQENVVVKNPDQEIRVKMAALAKRLGARVQGDEGEFYSEDGAPIPEMDSTDTPDPPPSQQRKPWWRPW